MTTAGRDAARRPSPSPAEENADASAASLMLSVLRSVRAVVFDTDGVLTDSARVHAAARRTAFDACLRAAGDDRPFDPVEDYRR